MLWRGGGRQRQSVLELSRARALFRAGDFEPAMVVVEGLLGDPSTAERVRQAALVLRLACLLFDERVAEAAHPYDVNRGALRRSRSHAADVLLIEGALAYHAGDVDLARASLTRAARRARRGDPIGGCARFLLGATAHREGDAEGARRWLGEANASSGDAFVGRWARYQHAALFGSPLPAPPSAPPGPRRRWRTLGVLAVAALACSIAGAGIAWTKLQSPPPPASSTTSEPPWDDNRKSNENAFVQAERLAAAERELLPGRPGVIDLYFVGVAGSSAQDVFVREVTSARALLDERFDTPGRSILLGNPPKNDETLPLAANATIRRAIEHVGGVIDREEDVLFLFLTSHGDGSGLSLQFPAHAGFSDEQLEPAELRAVLDRAGIRWRVIVVAGCQSGVFVEALASETTLLATAADAERPSYGCATGNAFTEFGRAIFGEQLRQVRSFPAAFRAAAEATTLREAEGGLLASRPRLSEGALVGAHLQKLEQRLAAIADTRSSGKE